VSNIQKPIHHPSNTALLQYCAMYSCHNIYFKYNIVQCILVITFILNTKH